MLYDDIKRFNRAVVLAGVSRDAGGEMNSRQRRKLAALEHNDRTRLEKDVDELQLAIYVKHGARVRFIYGDTNDILREQIVKLRGILENDTPPPRPAEGGSRARSGVYAGIALAALAGMSR